ncbi:MAG TPA: hypothetical protein VJT74_01365 [Pyrinomonadaceae bacterium]|nr:hypothetical protein [Pyrinomonadaceae bacterium]
MSELITIYLAAGAPFGFQKFLCARSLSQAVRAALLWPLAAVKFLFSRPDPDDAGTAAAQLHEQVGRAQGKLLSSLYALAESAQDAGVERAVRAAKEAVEKYVGLTLAAAETEADGAPTGRELELYRVAGRKGADLVLAGRCTRRRNAARLAKHQARSRVELLHALAFVCESLGPALARHACEMIVGLYACALDLLSLLGDEAAAVVVSRLKEELCTPHTKQKIFPGRPQARALNQG